MMPQTEPLLASSFDAEEAETANLEALEAAHEQWMESGRDRDAALQRFSSGAGPTPASAIPASAAKRRFQEGARKALLAKRLSQRRPQRRNSLAQDMLRHIAPQGAAVATGATPPANDTTGRHRSYDDVYFLSPLFDDSSDSLQADAESRAGSEALPSGTRYGTAPSSDVRSLRRPPLARPRARGGGSVWDLWGSLRHAVLRSPLLWLALPGAVAALVLFYPLSNPTLDFLPGNVTLAWWCNFLARQVVTLELARLLEFVVVDSILLRIRGTRLELINFLAFHLEGWPFVLIAWAAIDLWALRGSARAQVHWLWWTHWRIYSHGADSGAYILTSETYLRALLAMIFLGCAAAVKRCLLELRSGGRLFANFKPRLEQILKEIVLVTEIAALGEEAESVGELENIDRSSLRDKASKDIGLSTKNVSWTTAGAVVLEPQNGDTGATVDGADVTESSPAPAGRGVLMSEAYLSQSQSISNIEALLDRWEEPADKDKKGTTIGINDAVTFRGVLSHLKKKTPFGESFGPSWNRQATIMSSQLLYRRLLKLSDTSSHGQSLPFDTIAVVACDIDGTVDKDKLGALRKIFCPDAKNELPLLAFVGSIDAVYKRLRYFQASVANATKLDKVLEDTINFIFFFVIGLFILLFLKINPWPILVSITSVLVSVSFALGNSMSKWVEGVLLIAVRRPFDLGDRIIITGSETLENPGSTASWFVEDINLFSTTLRYARTNEVCSINNSSIAASRIINCNRSPSAIVFLDRVTHISILDGDNLKLFRESLETYVRDHPRIWDSLAFIRIENIDTNFEQVKFSIAVRHRNSWQDAGRILLNRADLLQFVYDTLKELDAAYDTPPLRQLLYYGGVLEEGDVKDYKKNLLSHANIRNNNKKEPETHGGVIDWMEKPLDGE